MGRRDTGLSVLLKLRLIRLQVANLVLISPGRLGDEAQVESSDLQPARVQAENDLADLGLNSHKGLHSQLLVILLPYDSHRGEVLASCPANYDQ